VIVRFKHRGLKQFYERGTTRGINADHVKKIREILTLLDIARGPEGLRLPQYRLHRLKGELKDFWSVWVSGNWRIIFRFEGEDVIDVELIDYH
jgi:toxin HigB-1